MRWYIVFLSILLAPLTLSLSVEKKSQRDVDYGKILGGLGNFALGNALSRMGKLGVNSGCDPSKLQIRKEWRTLSKGERKAYIKAVECMQSKPGLFSPAEAPGAKSLFDSFVAVHINKTLVIHGNAVFLTWHRYYVWTYERLLQTECGYKGAQPYWEWGLDVESPRDSPVFDGSDTSMGSDGAYYEHSGYTVGGFPTSLAPSNTTAAQNATPPANFNIPPGTGGGCVFKGPFVNYTVNLGPIAALSYRGENMTRVSNFFDYNPRCMKRDLNSFFTRAAAFNESTDLILNCHDVEHFQAVMQGDFRYTNRTGVHSGGHFTIGGDPGSDFFVSPGDPAFYLHHAQIDRVYAIWQSLDFPNRQNIFGTETMMNNPPSRNMTLDDYLDLEVLNTPLQIRDSMDTVGGTPFCYVYA